MDVSIHYQRVDELAINSLRSALETAARESGHTHAARLMGSHLTHAMREHWAVQDLELIGLTHEIEVLPKADIGWETVLGAFEPHTRRRLDAWLEIWHGQHEIIAMQLDAAIVRELHLTLRLPARPPIVTTSIHVQLPGGRNTATLGQPLPCKLLVRAIGEIAEGAQCTYELFAPTDTWLMGGRRKGVFSAQTALSVPIILIAQRAGQLLMPAIDIRCRKMESGHGIGVDSWEDLPIEVYNKSAAQCVQATASLQSATVGLISDEAATSGGAGAGMSSGVLLDSQSR